MREEGMDKPGLESHILSLPGNGLLRTYQVPAGLQALLEIYSTQNNFLMLKPSGTVPCRLPLSQTPVVSGEYL